jgi:poly-gamma-glutamate synthesis protein (capsule biosynthesis protein)
VDRELKILVGGDFYLQKRILAAKPDDLYREVDDLIAGADLRLIDVEAPFLLSHKRPAPIAKTGALMGMPRQAVDFLKGRFDVAVLANNHVLDYGHRPLADSIRLLRSEGIATVGAGKNALAAAAPLVVERKGFRVAIVAACENEFCLSYEDSPGAAGIDPSALGQTIRRLRGEHDIVLVYTHGGNEFNPLPSPRMVRNARHFADCGAHAVINCHPHVPQGIETWHGVPIAYALGNFCDEWHEPVETPLWWIGAPVMLTCRRTSTGMAVGMVPHPHRLDLEQARLIPLRGTRRQRYDRWLQEVSLPIQDDLLLRRFFRAWATRWGASYADHIQYHADNPDTPEGRRRYAAFRNLWCCEAHNELMTAYAEMRFRGDLGKAARLLPRLDRMGNPTFAR